jgi:exosortase
MQDRKSLILPGLVFGLFAVAYFPSWQILFNQWSELEEYSHAFLTVPIIGYIVWLKRKELQKQQSNWQQIVAMVILTFSTLCYLVASKFHFLSAINLFMVISMLAVLLYFLDLNSLLKLAFPLLLVIMLIPIPNQFYAKITVPLQLKVSQLSSFLMHLFNVPILREGNVLHLPNKTFEVIGACSGMRYIISIATLSLLLGYFTLTTTTCKIILAIFSIPIAFLVNIIRVMSMVLVYHYFLVDWTTGTAHTFMGVVIFGIALIALFFLQRILEFWEKRQTKN